MNFVSTKFFVKNKNGGKKPKIDFQETSKSF